MSAGPRGNGRGVAAALIAALAAAPAAYASEDVFKGKPCSITRHGHPPQRSNDCTIDSWMSQGRGAEIITMPNGKRFRIDTYPDTYATHLCRVDGEKGKIDATGCCTTRRVTAC
jgi:hypothetical protein